MEKTLQCHSKGDLRFSPFGARVKAFGKLENIENLYQSAKVFPGEVQPADWREARQLKRTPQIGWKIGPLRVNTRQDADDPRRFALDDFGIQWYCLLWAKYIRANPNLVTYASNFDAFVDPFAGNFPFCQARVWELVAKRPDGLNKLIGMGAELSGLIRDAEAG